MMMSETAAVMRSRMTMVSHGRRFLGLIRNKRKKRTAEERRITQMSSTMDRIVSS